MAMHLSCAIPLVSGRRFYYFDEEVAVAASERPVIQTSFNVKAEQIQELKPGHVLIIKKNGRITEEQFTKPKQKQACSFERIYFSRGTDKDIYKERKTLGKLLMPSILKSINYDLENTVFSYIPNTAAVAFKGLTEELNIFYNKLKTDQILELGKDANAERINKILSSSLRIEDIAVKDIKLRTFITQENSRNDLAGHVYDVTYGIIKEGVDNLVVIDDSIVRGTTLRQSIIRILDRLGPKKIIIASSAPQIRYPDCYGIDMTKLSEFVAFKAAIELLHDTRKEYIINEVYKNAKAQEQKPKEKDRKLCKKYLQAFYCTADF